ncbi:hypothetical protein B0H10DRAFT_580795 [Mycena sp. CBHHK59/15]|nr:hypothetical protein B0H10DRAFT_580795 [Mycena sp. CBHHK59/15]
MPSEILCDIFYLTLLSAELSYGSFETSESPWVLTHVCRHWRNIAISFPSLWNTIILRRVRCPLNMLQAQIKRAGNVLLEVRTSYLLEDVVGALAACSPRWGIVHCLPSLLSAISGRVPMLRELHLQGNVGSHEDQNLEDAPALREVSLRGFSVGFSPSLLPWAQLTHYRCEYGTWEVHIPALDLMRNLVQCQLCVVGLRYAHPHPIELPLLRDFKLDTVVAIPDCLVLPSLEDLFIIRQLDGLISMVRRSQCRLKKITLPVHLTTDSIVALFQESPTAVDITMTIRGDQMLIMDNLNRLFDKLSIISSSTECLLPDLERVTIVTSTPLLGFQGCPTSAIGLCPGESLPEGDSPRR